jgi:CheY-like chemotaxis protein
MTTRAMDLAGCGFDLPDCVRSHFETASHDLRQPLHALALFASQLQGSAPGGECHHLAVKIEAAVTALTERFDRLFDMFQSGCGASHGDEEQEANDGREEPRADVPLEPTVGKLVMVIDDEPLVLDSTCSLLRSWGCEVIGGHSAEATLAALAQTVRMPDLIICDFCLSADATGIIEIAKIRSAFQASIPAVLVSGDYRNEVIRQAHGNGVELVRKPAAPMVLRTVINRKLKTSPRR